MITCPPPPATNRVPPNYRGFPEATQETGAGRRPYSPPPLGTRLVRHQSAPVKLGPPHQGESPLVLHTKPQLGALGQRCSSRLMYHSLVKQIGVTIVVLYIEACNFQHV